MNIGSRYLVMMKGKITSAVKGRDPEEMISNIDRVIGGDELDTTLISSEMSSSCDFPH